MNNVVVARVAGMRKARTWTVMPTSDDRIIIQADGAIGFLIGVAAKAGYVRRADSFHILGSRRHIFSRSISFASQRVCRQVIIGPKYRRANRWSIP
jgi:hypothetical protein